MSVLDDFYDIPSAQSFGHYVTLVCPFHESYPVRNSLFVWEDYWKCLSCGKQGADHNYLLNALNSGSTLHFETSKFSNPWTKWIREYGSTYEVCKKGFQALKSFPQQQYYLQKRGIPTSEIQNLKLGYLEGWYLFPIIRKDSSVAAVARKGEGFQDQANKYVTPSKVHQDNYRLLYVPGGWKQLETAESVFLTFGIVSSISIFLNGKTAISTVSGTTLDHTALDGIRKLIYIVPDYKEEDKALQLANKLGWRGKVLYLPYESDIADPNDVYMKNPHSLRKILDSVA